SVLVALGTSILLVALIGLGLTELRSEPGGGATAAPHTEAAAVVVPALVTHRHVAAGKMRHPSVSTRSSVRVLAPSPPTASAAAPVTRAKAKATAPVKAPAKTAPRTRSTTAPRSPSTRKG